MRVFIQSKSGDHNAIIKTTEDMSRTFVNLKKAGGYYCESHGTPPVLKLVSFNEIEFIREATDDDIV